MAYVRLAAKNTPQGFSRCGAGCPCNPFRVTSGALGEWYIEEDGGEKQTSPLPPPAARLQRVPSANLSGPPWLRRVSLARDLQLRMPAFETITGFAHGGASLNAAQLERVNRAAEFIARSWAGTSPITSIRITGYIDANEWQSTLGQRRAVAVRDSLIRALNSARPGLATRLRWIIEDRGYSPVAKVEIYLWAGPTPPPIPPLVRVPSPAEAAGTVIPMGPETPEQRIGRILRTLPPPPPPRRTLSEAFWRRLDERLNSIMSRVGVPRSLRGPIRDGVHAAVRRVSEELLNRVLEASRLPSEVQEAIRGTVRAVGGLTVP